MQGLCASQPPRWTNYKEAEITPGAEGGISVSTSKGGSGVKTNLDVKGNAKYTYSAEVRGEGQITPYVLGGHGWYYGKKVALDTKNWIKVSIIYASHTPKVMLVLANAASAASFEVRNLKVEEAVPDELADVEMPPTLLQASEYPGETGKVRQNVAGAFNGKAVWGKRWYNLCRLPVPGNSRPLFYYVHAKKTGENKFSFYLKSYPHTYPASKSYEVPNAGGWGWVKVGPVSASLLERQAYLTCSSDTSVECMVDKIIVTTQDNLTPEALDNVKGMMKQASLQNGFVCIGRGTPVIDGKLDDDAWKNSIALTNFQINCTSQSAKEQTTVRLLWDDENLYVSFHCMEQALRPLNNRIGDFIRNYKGHDASNQISKDDTVEFLLFNPGTPGKVYDIIVSASGAFNDSLDTIMDQEFWSKRDFKWESDAKTAVLMDATDKTGYWNVEIALPWSKMGGKPSGNAGWKMVATRSEKAFKEKSSYQLVSTGVHAIDALGDIAFVNSVPGIEVEKMPEYVPGGNNLTVSLRTEAPLALFTKVKYSQDTFNSETFASKSDAKIKHDFNLSKSGHFDFCWGIRGSADMQEYYRSPTYSMDVVTTFLTASLDKAVLKLNGTPVKGKAMLCSGLNTLVLEANEDAKVAITAADYKLPFPTGWLREPQSGKYTLKLFLDRTEVWPNWRHKGISIIKGGLQQILLVPNGFPDCILKDYTLYLDLPEGISFVGASGYYRNYKLECSEIGTVKYGKKTLRRHALRVIKDISARKNIPGHELIAAVVSVSPDFPDKETVFYFHAGSAEKGIAELPSKVNVHIMPSIKGKQPILPLGMRMCSGWLGSMEDKRLVKAILRYFAEMGINESRTVPEEGQVPEIGKREYFNFRTWNFDITPYMAKHPEQMRINEKGKTVSGQICSSAYLEAPQFRDFLAKGLKPWHEKRYRPGHVNWDYEANVFDSDLACYCPTCLKKFADEENVQEKDLTPAVIKAKYRKQWMHYMVKKMADISGLHQKLIHEELPGVIYSVYSAYQSEKALETYGIDWNMLAGKMDLAMVGYGRKEDELFATRAAVKNTPLALGVICYPHDFAVRTAPDFIGKARLLRRAVDATAGVLIYNYPTLDGRSFEAIAAVSNIMAQYQDFFISNIRANELLTVRGYVSSEYEVLGNGKGDYLIAIMNPSKNPRQFKATFKFPAGKKLYEYATGKEVQNDFSGNLPSEGIAVYVTK